MKFSKIELWGIPILSSWLAFIEIPNIDFDKRWLAFIIGSTALFLTCFLVRLVVKKLREIFSNHMNVKRILIVLGFFILILLFTNPSLNDFIESGHLTDNNFGNFHNTYRDSNYLIFSKYCCKESIVERNERVERVRCHLGVLKNFYEIKN